MHEGRIPIGYETWHDPVTGEKIGGRVVYGDTKPEVCPYCFGVGYHDTEITTTLNRSRAYRTYCSCETGQRALVQQQGVSTSGTQEARP